MKFSIITPAYDIGTWLPQTIESVLSQAGDFEIEYILVINDSPDNTLSVAREYKEKLDSGSYQIACKKISMQIIEAGKPNGMYVALNEGFSTATGDIFAWIAGDDTYEPSAFEIMRKAFTAFPDIEWLKGISSIINDDGTRQNQGTCRLYHRDWLRLGVYGMESYHVEQDSVFWRASLWHKVEPFPSYFKSAGDYWLWLQMAKHASLMTTNAPISCFRKRAGQDSRINSARLLSQKASARPTRPLGAWIPRLFFWPYFHAPESFRPLFESLYRYVFPFKSRRYIEIEKGVLIEKNMTSFVLH